MIVWTNTSPPMLSATRTPGRAPSSGPIIGTKPSRPQISPSASADGTPMMLSPTAIAVARHGHRQQLAEQPILQGVARGIEGRADAIDVPLGNSRRKPRR
jgi:hypothetical protein